LKLEGSLTPDLDSEEDDGAQPLGMVRWAKNDYLLGLDEVLPHLDKYSALTVQHGKKDLS
jgi:hypothetical protein